MLDVAGDTLDGDRQHRRRRRDLRRLRLPRPRPRHVLAGRPHRRARLGPGRRHVRRDGRAARARRRGLVQPRRPRPRASACERARRLAGGRAADRGARRARARARASRRGSSRCATSPSARACRPGDALGAVPGVHDPAGGKAAIDFRGDRGRRCAASTSALPTPEVLAAIASATAILVGPSNPVISDRPDPRGPRRCATRCASAPRRSSPSRRSSAGTSLKGPTEALPRVGRRRWTRPGSPRCYGDAARRARRRRAGRGGLPVLADRHVCPTPERPPPRARPRRWSSPTGWPHEAARADDGRGPPGQALPPRPSSGSTSGSAGRDAPRAGRGDGHRRARRAAPRRERRRSRLRRHGRADGRRARAAATTPTVSSNDPDDAGHVAAARCRRRRGASRAAPTGSCSCPATARRWTPARLRRAALADGRAGPQRASSPTATAPAPTRSCSRRPT